MTRPRISMALLAAGAACAVAVGTPGVASAHGGGSSNMPTARVINETVVAPFQLAARRGKLYVADGGATPATVSRVTRSGLVTLATAAASSDVAGVAVNKRGDLAYTTTTSEGGGEGPGENVASYLVIKRKHGRTLRVDLHAFEVANNPDAGVSYGIDNPTPCQEEAFDSPELGGASNPGGVDSHPYAVAALPHGGWVVADAGGNDLLKVDRKGRVSLIAVLPRQPTTITAAAAAALGLPECVVGAVYNFEPVPTDVEVGRHGKLVVSLLPGGPEDPSLGPRGSVVEVNPWTGRTHKIADGFLGATNIAQDGSGRIFVAELFAGRISVIEHGKVKKYIDLPGALSLVWSRGTLYAGTTNIFTGGGPGTLVAIR